MKKYPQFIFPSSLSPHPKLLHNQPDKTTSEWEDFVDDIEDNGIREPILFMLGENNAWQIVDGIRRWTVALEIPLPEVLAIRLSEKEGAAILAEKNAGNGDE